MARAGVAVLLLCGACAPQRDPAPEDLDGLVRYMFQHWEDEALMSEAMANLTPWLDSDGSSEEAYEGYLLGDLTELEVDGIVRPAQALLGEATGLAQTGVSSYGPLDHAELIVQSDQTWNEPSTYARFVRDVVEGDPDSFARGAGMVRTENDIEKSGAFGVSIPFLQNKDYRWVEVDGVSTIVGRSWVEESSCSDNGKNCVVQSYSIDLFHPTPNGGVVRLMAGWNELTTEVDALLSQDFLIQQMVQGNREIMENTELALSGEL
jgi:hypothetical protein